MRRAVSMVKSGSSIRYTAESVGVKRSTLWSYIKKEKKCPNNAHIMHWQNYACRRVFTDEEEVSRLLWNTELLVRR